MVIHIENKEGIEYLKQIEDKSIDLILTDPPYIISKDSGMNKHHDLVKNVDKNNTFIKTEDDWIFFKKRNI